MRKRKIFKYFFTRLMPVITGAFVLGLIIFNLRLDWTSFFSGDLAGVEKALSVLKQASGAKTAWLMFFLIGVLPFAMVPYTVISFGAATLLEPGWAVLVIVGGALLNTTLGFWASKFIGRQVVEKWVVERFSKIRILDEGSSRHGLKMAFLSRFMPFPFAYTAVIAGLTRIKYWQMLVGTFFPMLAVALIYVLALDSVRKGSMVSLSWAFLIMAGLLITGWKIRTQVVARKSGQ
jgi:uncharacterized membrane protein YdjX (TVP38/TMEM64 family)